MSNYLENIRNPKTPYMKQWYMERKFQERRNSRYICNTILSPKEVTIEEKTSNKFVIHPRTHVTEVQQLYHLMK